MKKTTQNEKTFNIADLSKNEMIQINGGDGEEGTIAPCDNLVYKPISYTQCFCKNYCSPKE